MDTVTWQRIEGTLVFLAGLALSAFTGYGVPWWWAVLVFFVPDLSFAAYSFGSRWGAVVYNAAHMYALGIILVAFGAATDAGLPSALGSLWLAHSGFDRMLGYGLKSPAGFNVTHLGRIGGSKAK